MRVFYTDGSTHNNGKPDAVGAYAWVEVSEEGELLRSFSSQKDPSGQVPTNIRMEMMAVVSALHHCNEGDSVRIISDSAYVINGMNEAWYKRWGTTGKTSMGKTPKNLDLWNLIVRATNRMKRVEWVHVKGHQGDKYNEMCDELAGRKTEHYGEYGGTL